MYIVSHILRLSLKITNVDKQQVSSLNWILSNACLKGLFVFDLKLLRLFSKCATSKNTCLMSNINYIMNEQLVPLLNGEFNLFRLLLFLAHNKDEAAELFFLAGLFFSCSLCSFMFCSRFCLCKDTRCCCSVKLGMRPWNTKEKLTNWLRTQKM